MQMCVLEQLERRLLDTQAVVDDTQVELVL